MSNINNKIAIGDALVSSMDGADIMYDESTSVSAKIDELNSNLGEDENGMTVHEKLNDIMSFFGITAGEVTIEFTEVANVSAITNNYTFVDNSYYLIAVCGYYNSTARAVGSITTDCEYILLGADNDFLTLWLVKGQVDKTVTTTMTGGGVASYKQKIFKITGI